MAPRTTNQRIEVGDDVVLPVGRLRLPSRVIEDRGNLGVNGERILRIVTDLGEGAHDIEREVPEDVLELP
ncbi:MAG: hypothetical protein JSU06_04540 [Actinobacteria bacterium]|nr:hypothetical protein [Actinomycetota bacterium]